MSFETKIGSFELKVRTHVHNKKDFVHVTIRYMQNQMADLILGQDEAAALRDGIDGLLPGPLRAKVSALKARLERVARLIDGLETVRPSEVPWDALRAALDDETKGMGR